MSWDKHCTCALSCFHVGSEAGLVFMMQLVGNLCFRSSVGCQPSMLAAACGFGTSSLDMFCAQGRLCLERYEGRRLLVLFWKILAEPYLLVVLVEEPDKGACGHSGTD